MLRDCQHAHTDAHSSHVLTYMQTSPPQGMYAEPVTCARGRKPMEEKTTFLQETIDSCSLCLVIRVLPSLTLFIVLALDIPQENSFCVSEFCQHRPVHSEPFHMFQMKQKHLLEPENLSHESLSTLPTQFVAVVKLFKGNPLIFCNCVGF